MVLLGLLGQKRVGKDTMADYLVEHYGFHKLVFAEPLKEACRAIFGFDDAQLYGERKEEEDPHWKITPRKAFQYLGTDIIRHKFEELVPGVGKDFWLHRLLVDYRKLQDQYGAQVPVIVSDLRFQNEVDFIQQQGGTVIKLQRTGLQNHDQHESEALIEQITNYDRLIENNGSLESYLNKVKEMVQELIASPSESSSDTPSPPSRLSTLV